MIGIGSYIYYTENNPHYDCKTLAEIPIDFTSYGVYVLCEATYSHKIGPFDALHITIIGDELNSNMRKGNSGKLIIHLGKRYKFGYKYPEHCFIEFGGEIQKIYLGSIYFYGYKNDNNDLERISLKEIIDYIN